jgi:hypothetical protein
MRQQSSYWKRCSLCARAKAISGESKQKRVSLERVVSLLLAFGRQTRRRLSLMVTHDGGVGGGGAPIFINPFVAISNKF